MSSSFEIQHRDPEQYRKQSRQGSVILAVIFALFSVGLSYLYIALFSTPDADNLRYNIAGVVSGLVLTIIVFQTLLRQQPIMASALYGWQLKRSLMRVTNMMHHVEAGVDENNPAAIKLLRFYHLGLTEMHRLEGNDSALSDLAPERRVLEEKMKMLDIPLEQYQLNPDWIDQVKPVK